MGTLHVALTKLIELAEASERAWFWPYFRRFDL